MDSEQCVCRHKSLKPKVAIKAESKEATFKAGETMVFWADVKGEPMCEDIVWSLGGKQVRIYNLGINIVVNALNQLYAM